VSLCAIIAAICAAPLAFVEVWVAVWLLTLITILVLGTFGIWAFHTIRNPRLLDTEHHQEKMAEISLLGVNQPDQSAIVKEIVNQPLVENSRIGLGEQQ
jgi:CDP-diglyceride synthetase